MAKVHQLHDLLPVAFNRVSTQASMFVPREIDLKTVQNHVVQPAQVNREGDQVETLEILMKNRQILTG